MDSKWLNVILLGLPMLFKFILDLTRCRREKKTDKEAQAYLEAVKNELTDKTE